MVLRFVRSLFGANKERQPLLNSRATPKSSAELPDRKPVPEPLELVGHLAFTLSRDPSPSNLEAFLRATDFILLQDLNEAEHTIRQNSSHAWDYGPVASRRKEVVPWLDCLDYDGFKREKALKLSVAPIPNKFWLAVLLRRLNDWVPEVQKEALKKLLALKETWDDEDIADILWEIGARMNSWGRLANEGREFLVSLLEQEGVLHHLAAKFCDETNGPLPTKFTALVRSKSFAAFLPNIAQNARHPGVRALAYRSVFSGQIK